MDKPGTESKIGTLSMVGAYTLWGITPIYWKLMDTVPAGEILAHRIFWALMFMLVLLFLTRQAAPFCNEIKHLVKQPGKVLWLTAATVLISINWGLFIWAVANDRSVELSLSYYIIPLINVLMGVIFLKESLSRPQVIAICLAAAGVVLLTVPLGHIPWISLVMAACFGVYGYIKKIVVVGSATGLTIETLLISPFALGYMLYLAFQASGTFAVESVSLTMLLIGGGPLTALPLLLFAFGAKRITLIRTGFLQYINPTIILFIGVVIFHEPFSSLHLVAFTFIWTACLIYSLSHLKTFRGNDDR